MQPQSIEQLASQARVRVVNRMTYLCHTLGLPEEEGIQMVRQEGICRGQLLEDAIKSGQFHLRMLNGKF